MKLLVIIFIFSLFTFAYTITSTSSIESSCDKVHSCHTCQKTIYELKFQHQVVCHKFAHCRSTCVKVMDEWSRPGGKFNAFISDTIGKCDACFRAGFCSMTECHEDKRKEESIIEHIIDAKNLMGKSEDTREMDKMVKKVLNHERVDFKRVAHRVKQKVRHALNRRHFLNRTNTMAKSLQRVVGYKPQD